MSTGMKAVNSVNCSACGLCLQSSLLLLRSEIKVILKMQMHLFCYKVNNRRDKAHLSTLLILSELSSLSLPSHTFPPRSHNSPAFLLIYDECLHLFFFPHFLLLALCSMWSSAVLPPPQWVWEGQRKKYSKFQRIHVVFQGKFERKAGVHVLKSADFPANHRLYRRHPAAVKHSGVHRLWMARNKM